MFTEDHQSSSNKKYDTKATTFFRMGPKHFVTLARFSISHRSDIARFIQRFESDTRKQVDFFFICQQIHLITSQHKSTYFAVLDYDAGSSQNAKCALQAIQYCKVLEVSAMTIQELYEKMCATDFMEINIFERLGRADTKVLRKTANPFAQIYLYRNVSLFSNLDMAIKFINEDMPNLKNLCGYLQKRTQITTEQKKLSYILFGTIKKNLIHLTQQTRQSLLRLSDQLKRYELKNEEAEMRDQNDEFDDVTYADFQENMAMTEQDLTMMTNLKEMRNSSICEIRDKLKDAERRLNREDPFEKM